MRNAITIAAIAALPLLGGCANTMRGAGQDTENIMEKTGAGLDELARIWKGGCIIRAAFLDQIRATYRRNPKLDNLLLDSHFAQELSAREGAWRRVAERAVSLGLAIPGMSASLAYFDTLRRARGPANLIQAQRDLFGAHTYERIDREGTFHTDWN